MAGWVLSTLLWALFAASIYFVGHLAQLKLTQNYQSFQTVMQGVAQQSILTGQCVDRQEVGSLLPYKQCIETRWGRLAHADRSEERRVGKECGCRWSRTRWKKRVQREEGER